MFHLVSYSSHSSEGSVDTVVGKEFYFFLQKKTHRYKYLWKFPSKFKKKRDKVQSFFLGCPLYGVVYFSTCIYNTVGYVVVTSADIKIKNYSFDSLLILRFFFMRNSANVEVIYETSLLIKDSFSLMFCSQVLHTASV
jgi:hypothetical protein